jgi:hypothetical protein
VFFAPASGFVRKNTPFCEETVEKGGRKVGKNQFFVGFLFILI